MAEKGSCRHEAGHTVALLALNHQIESVFARVGGRTVPVNKRLRARHRAIVAFAGPIAEYGDTDGVDVHMQSEDRTALSDALKNLCGNSERNKQRLFARAARIVRSHADAIDALALLLESANATPKVPVPGDRAAAKVYDHSTRRQRTVAMRWQRRRASRNKDADL